MRLRVLRRRNAPVSEQHLGSVWQANLLPAAFKRQTLTLYDDVVSVIFITAVIVLDSVV
jgi:hypothetical protein